MGVVSGIHFTTKLVGLNFGQSRAILNSRAEKNGRPNQPAIDIDASWLWYKFMKRAGGPFANIIDLIMWLARDGFAVTVVCDADERHHSKRDSIKRRVTREYARLAAIEAKGTIMKLSLKLRNGNYADAKEREELEDKRDWLGKYVSSAEGSGSGPPDDFFNALRDALTARDPGHHGGSIRVVKAIWQADFYIAGRMAKGGTDAVLSNDADYSIHAGQECMCLSDLKFDSGKGMADITFSSGFRDVIKEAARAAGINIEEKNKAYVEADFPILEGASPRLRCLLAIGIGCDSFPGGVPNLGTPTISKRLTDPESPSHFDDLLKWFSEKSKITPQVLLAFVDSLMYEPINEEGDERLEYLHEEPLSLPKYLESFASSSDIVEDGPELCRCHGYGSGEHIFMKEEGAGHCGLCDNTLCRLCVLDVHKRENRWLKKFNKTLLPDAYRCMECFSQNAVSSEVDIRLEERRKKLSEEIGNTVPKDATITELMDIYDKIVDKKELDCHSSLIATEVKFPILSASSLKDGTLRPLLKFDFTEGARFLRDERLSTSQVIAITDLLASLVVYSDPSDNSLQCYADVLPELIMIWSTGSRGDSGERLRERCVRNGMDKKTESAIKAGGEVFEHEGEVGLVMNHNIQASFKSDRYDTSVAFTKTAIMACACSCPAGAEMKDKHDKHVDVHVLPVIYLLVLLLFDDLAEHVLLEVAQRWTAEDDVLVEARVMLKAVDLLMMAAGRPKRELERGTKVSDLLKSFTVGTENNKRGPPPPKADEVAGPLRDHHRLTKPKTVAKSKIRRVLLTDSTAPNDESGNNPADLADASENTEAARAPGDAVGQAPGSADAALGGDSQAATAMDAELPADAAADIEPTADTAQHAEAAGPPGNVAEQPRGSSDPPADANTDTDAVGPTGNGTEQPTANAESTAGNMQPPEDDAESSGDLGSDQETLPPAYFLITRFITAWKDKFKGRSSSYMNYVGYRLVAHRAGERSPQETEMIDKGVRGNVHVLFESAGGQRGSPDSKINQEEGQSENVAPTTRNVPNTDMSPDRSPKRPGARRSPCCFANCGCVEGNHWPMAPRMPKPVPSDASFQRKKTYAKKRYHREEYLRRCGLDIRDEREKRICDRHEFEDVSKSVPLSQYFDVDDKTNEPKSFTAEFHLPVAAGKKSIRKPATSSSSGLGRDRQLRRFLQTSKTVPKDATREELVEDLVSWKIMSQQSIELMSQQSFDSEPQQSIHLSEESNDINDSINEGVLEEAEMSVHESTPSPSNKKRLRDYIIPPNKKRKPKKKARKRKRKSTSKDPVVNLDISDKHVKERTGFDGLLSLLFFVTLSCNGDMELMMQTSTSLTWFEEWFLYLEMEWGRSLRRWCDAERLYRIDGSHLKRSVFDRKLAVVIRSRASWPVYVSMEEDRKLRREKWNIRYDGKRVIMWDNTDIKLSKPSDASLQRLTYSAYYGGNVGKGAVFLQLCGWLGTHELWTGHVSDTEYFENSGILERQSKFVDESDEPDIKVTNVLDKGYRSILAAWRTGRQLLLQPAFKRSDRKFTSREVLTSAAVASDRAGNERAVNVCKRSGMLQRGPESAELLSTVADVWLAWGFQANFMYAPVL